MDIIFIVESDILTCGSLAKWIQLNFDFQICANGILPKTAFCLAPYEIYQHLAYLRYDQYCYTMVPKGFLRSNSMWSGTYGCNCEAIVPDRVEKYKRRGYKIIIGSYDDYLIWRQRGCELSDREEELKSISIINEITDTNDEVDYLNEEEKMLLELKQYQEEEEIDSILQLFSQ